MFTAKPPGGGGGGVVPFGPVLKQLSHPPITGTIRITDRARYLAFCFVTVVILPSEVANDIEPRDPYRS